jgi:hypothetical protein
MGAQLGKDNPTPRAADLQFDYADMAAAAQGVVCATCKQTVADRYYEIDGQITCAPCRGKLADTAGGAVRLGRFVLAALAGAVAAGLGAGLYYAVAAISGYEIGLVAIVLGALVGGAVRWGSRRRGGWMYQLLALLLTYASIGASYSIFALRAYYSEHPDAFAQTQPTIASAPVIAGAEDTGSDETKTAANPVPPTPTPQEALKALVILAGGLLMLVFSLPVLASIQQPIGFLIVAVALYQAWRMNRRSAARVTGPYMVGMAAAPSVPKPDHETAHE